MYAPSARPRDAWLLRKGGSHGLRGPFSSEPLPPTARPSVTLQRAEDCSDRGARMPALKVRALGSRWRKGARDMRRLLMLVTIALLPLGLFAAPASATVHEIVGQWCSGQGDLSPPGISGGSNADNFARPLFASGFATIVAPFDPDGPGGADEGVLVAFDFDHPASKIVSLGFFVQIDTLPDGSPLYVEAFELDTSQGFTNCARLSN